MRPTDEQQDALSGFRTGDSMVIEAGAGTGKTSTLRLLAYSTLRHGRYVAFNKAIVQDVKGTMTQRVDCSTAHSLAFAAVGRPYRHRLNSDRMKGWQIAQTLGIEGWTISYGQERKRLQEGTLGSLTMRVLRIFTQTTDEQPELHHFPYVDGIDPPTPDGKLTWENNGALRERLLPALRQAWADACSTSGQLPYVHDNYLKLAFLQGLRIPADFILFDEAQDANPVMAAIVSRQEHAQLVYVGDSAQAIYEFTGAINAMAGFDVEHRHFLSQSFRFGPMIAEEANSVLAELGAPIRLSGLGSIPSVVGPLTGELPDCILARTNAKAVSTVLEKQKDGVPTHLVGGGGEVVSFARAALELREGRPCFHAELACFNSWGEVQEYVRQDPNGDELRLMVELVDEFTPEAILAGLGDMTPERQARLVVSTAHKAKGREWDRVQLAGDFNKPEPTDAELRLRYVAYTRARLHLDNSALIEDEPAVPLPSVGGDD